jgi:hypothetical protein
MYSFRELNSSCVNLFSHFFIPDSMYVKYEFDETIKSYSKLIQIFFNNSKCSLEGLHKFSKSCISFGKFSFKILFTKFKIADIDLHSFCNFCILFISVRLSHNSFDKSDNILFSSSLNGIALPDNIWNCFANNFHKFLSIYFLIILCLSE